MKYQDFLKAKSVIDAPTGLREIAEINPILFPYQRDIVRWALMRGRAAIFADCGMGKSFMQLEWARQVPGMVLILAPLSVAQQTADEGAKLGIHVNVAKTQADCVPGINITNYEKFHNFNPAEFTGVVLDESSIIKSTDGKTRNLMIESFQKTPFRLCCTATPSPNDFMEIGNHAEFLGVMSQVEMLSMFFVHDGGETQKWRLKGHAETEFWKWICSWGVMIRKPSDLGYSNDGFVLPPIEIFQHQVVASGATDGMLFKMEAQTLQERLQARRDTIGDRVKKAAEIANASAEKFLVWCNLNNESEELQDAIDGAVEVTGSDSDEKKCASMHDFIHGETRVLVSKPSICGFGVNLQCCHNIIFVGLSDSFEQYYQAVRRCYRFGQKHAVKVHIITADIEGAVVQNIKRKEKEAIEMAENMVEHMREISTEVIHSATERKKDTYKREVVESENYTAHLGDCVEVVSEIKDETVGYSIYSPPFASLYTYSNSDRDMGNCKDDEEFMNHYRFLVREIFRATKPGRLTSFHCMNLPTSKARDGVIGIRDFRGELIRMHIEEGWIFHSEVCIWKDPVTAMQRTKALGLLHKTIRKDSAMSRQGIPDYLVTMRKPGQNDAPLSNTHDEFPVSEWQKIASPVWMDINPSETLQHRSAREENDERHICPLQLEVIRRGLKLWSRKDDLVLSPFMGIGSEGYCALEMGRKFIGSELKASYFKQAVKNLRSASVGAPVLFEQVMEECDA
jgi:DNA modification methylase